MLTTSEPLFGRHQIEIYAMAFPPSDIKDDADYAYYVDKLSAVETS